MDPYSPLPPTPLRISTSAPLSPNYPNQNNSKSPTSFPGPTGIGAPFVDYRHKPLFPDSQRDDIVSKTEGVYGEAEYFGSQMMNRRRIPMHHDPRQPTSRHHDNNSQFLSPSRHYGDVDPRGIVDQDSRGRGEYERRQYVDEMQSPGRGPSSYYDARNMESSQQYTPRRYYDEPDTYMRDPREESMYARMPQHHHLSNSYDRSSAPYQRATPLDHWPGETGRPGSSRRSPNDHHDTFLPYEEFPQPSNTLRRDPTDFDHYASAANPRRASVDYERDYQERPMRPLTPPMDRVSSPPPRRRRSKSRERIYARSDSDTDDFRMQHQHKAPVREHFFPHHKRRLKGTNLAESDDDPSSSSTSSSSEVVQVRRSRSNGRRRKNSTADITEALPVFDAVSSSESSDSDVLPVRERGRSSSRSRDEQRAARTSSQRQHSAPKQQSRPHDHYVIDLSNVPTPKRHVTFSPSTEVNFNSVDDLTADGSFTAYGKKLDNYAQRMADAALLREQSEARHQILQEIRQAMEMRDLAADDSDHEFWQTQIGTLNASLRKLTVSFDEPTCRTPNGTMIRHDDRDDTLSSSRHDTDRGTTSTSQSSTIVKVRAPEDLAGGHKFTVRVNGKKLVARVPQGGVFKGDTFSIRLPAEVVDHPSIVKVRAPASLPEGYKFTAKMDDQTIVATVPPGGVKKGEIFTVEVLEYV